MEKDKSGSFQRPEVHREREAGLQSPAETRLLPRALCLHHAGLLGVTASS